MNLLVVLAGNTNFSYLDNWNLFFEVSFSISLFNSLGLRCNCLSFDLSSCVLSCLMLTFLNFVDALFKFVQISHEKIFNHGICEFKFSRHYWYWLPKQVHLNVSFLIKKDRKSLTNSLSFYLLFCSLKLNNHVCSFYTIINRLWYFCSYRYIIIN